MADKRISELNPIDATQVAAVDPIAISDLSASETKKITAQALANAVNRLASDGSIDPDKIDWPSGDANEIDGEMIIVNSMPGDRLEDGTLPGSKIEDDGIGEDQLADECVDTNHIKPGAVTGGVAGVSRIAADTITADNLAANCVGSSELADNSVDTAAIQLAAVTGGAAATSRIAANTITADNLAENSVGNSELGTDAVETINVLNESITADKLSSDSVTNDKILDDTIENSKLKDIETDAIADSAVTETKLANNSVATSKIKAGAVTGGVGGKIAADTITANEIAPNAINASELNDNSVDTAALQPISVTEPKLGSSSVSTRTLQDDSVTNPKLADNCINSWNYIDGSIDEEHYATDSVSGRAIGPLQVGTTHLNTDAVTAPKIADNAVRSEHILSGEVITDSLADDCVTPAKLGVVCHRGLEQDPGGLIGLDHEITPGTYAGIDYDQYGRITNVTTGDIPATDLPVATSTTIGAISVPLQSGLSVDGAGAIDHITLVSPGSGVRVTVDEHGHVTDLRNDLLPTDIPPAGTTAETRGAVFIPPTDDAADANPLTVNTTTGELIHSPGTVAPGIYAVTTVDKFGHVTSGRGLQPGEIPGLDASVIVSGQFGSDRIEDNSITKFKLADFAISYIQESQPSVVDPGSIGMYWYQESTGQLRVFNGNSWMPVGFGRLSQDNLRWGGTIDASTGLVVNITDAGATAGLTAGDPLPVATNALGGLYVVCSVAGNNISVDSGTNYDSGDWCLCVNESEGWIRIDVAAGGGGGSALLTLGELLDVDINSPQTGDTLIYDATSARWFNRTTTADRVTLSPGFDGVRTSFTLSTTVLDQNNVTLSISGVIQEPGVDFTITPDSTDISFSSPPPANSPYFLLNQQTVNSSGGGGGGGTVLPPGSSANEFLQWNNDLGSWGPASEMNGGTY